MVAPDVIQTVHDEILKAAEQAAAVKAQQIRESVGLDALRATADDSGSEQIVVDAITPILDTVAGGAEE